MAWLKPALFVVIITSAFVTGCCAHNNSYYEVVQRYELCVLRGLPRTHIFSEEDRVRMVKIVNEANQRMHLLHMDPTNASNARTMLRLFAAALANLMADSNVPETSQRQDAFITVIEICSSSLPRPIAEKLVQDVKRIFASAENARLDSNESPVLSRRKEMSSETSGLVSPDDHAPLQRSKRSPQAVAFSTFGGWQPTESLQSVLSNILLNSNAFMNVFRDGISRRDAISLARSMVEAGLVNYHFSVIQDVVNSIANTISSFPFMPESADYAFAISSSTASVLDARQLSFFADGVGIGNGLVSKLQSMISNRAPTASFPMRSDGAAASFSWGTSGGSMPSQQRMMGSQAPADSFPTSSDGAAAGFSWGSSSDTMPSQQRTVSSSQVNSGFAQSQQPSSAFTSSQTDSEEFQGDLAFFLYQSSKIQDSFCNGPFQGIFEMVSGGLAEYGIPIASTAASIVNDSLTSMDPDMACAQFGNVISETVTTILRDNNLLQSANALDIADKMASNLNSGQDSDFQAYDSSPQEPPIYSEFSFPETQPSDLIPEFQYEPPQYPNSGMLPIIPGDETEDNPKPQEFSYETFDSEQIPVQQPKMSEEYPPSNPGPESAVPFADVGDATGTSDTDTSSVQQASSDLGTEESGAQQLKSSKVSNPQILSDASAPLDSEKPLKDDSEKSPDEFKNSQSEAYSEQKNSGASTNLPPNRTVFTENRDTQTSTTVNLITTTTPYPYTTTSLDASKVAAILLDDIYSSLRTLNSSSGGEVKPQKDSSAIESKDSSVGSESSTIQDVPQRKKIESSETKLTTIPDQDSHPKQGTPVYLEPSLRTTPFPDTTQRSSVTGFKNATQTSDDARAGELELRDPTQVFAEHVSAIATSTIALIRSGDVNLQDLCNKVNELAPVVDIPPLDVCNNIALVDYLLNVLKAVTFILRSV